MNALSHLEIPYESSICYSGYRKNQSPIHGTYPTYSQIYEDLQILEGEWKYLRIYDCSTHADLVLDVIRKEKLNFKIMLGADVAAEESNPNCPWDATYPTEVLVQNRKLNDAQIERQILLANKYEDIVFAVSIGNECTVDWSDHLVTVERLISFARILRQHIIQPITFCENYVPWVNKLTPLVEELDFISIHTYPVWEYQSVESALEYTKQNYYSVADFYPNMPVIITEAGWTTHSNGRGIEPWNASELFQKEYCTQLLNWSNEAGILTFLFEAFDEPWKGSDDEWEPEKHWGIYTVERTPKLFANNTISLSV